MTYKSDALKAGMLYTVSDVPSAPLGILLGFQHFLTMLGATALIPILLVPAMGGTPEDTAEVISTIFFVSGLNTLLQTTFGDRLPIIQGGSFAFLGPTFGIIVRDRDSRPSKSSLEALPCNTPQRCSLSMSTHWARPFKRLTLAIRALSPFTRFVPLIVPPDLASYHGRRRALQDDDVYSTGRNSHHWHRANRAGLYGLADPFHPLVFAGLKCAKAQP
jgi:hypothetical protein